MREYDEPERNTEQATGAIAGRLDDLTSKPVPADMVDEILRRAIEYQLGDEYAAVEMDDATLERAAAEVGIDPIHLRRALAEVRVATQDESSTRLERLFSAPPRMAETRTVALSRHQAEAAIVDWMRQHEGMRMRTRIEDGAEWEKDSHLLTQLRMGLKLGKGSGAVRDARNVTHRVQSIGDGQQVLSLEADSSLMAKVGAGLLSAGAAGALVGGGAAVVNGADPALVGLAAAGGFGLWAGGTVLGIRMWARSLRDGLRRAIDGAAHPELQGSDDSLLGQFDRLRRGWSTNRRRTRPR